MRTPLAVLLEMMLRAPVTVPPITLAVAPESISTPLSLPSGAGPLAH